MTKYALVEPSGRVAQVEKKTFPVAEPYKWIPCPDKTTTSYVYVDEQFVELTEETQYAEA